MVERCELEYSTYDAGNGLPRMVGLRIMDRGLTVLNILAPTESTVWKDQERAIGAAVLGIVQRTR